jgi:pimeloyl-ACP methyl ester carboxylesterase
MRFTGDGDVRFGYADTPAGQVHYRRAGEGPAFVFLHWAPGHGGQYRGVLPAVAAADCAGFAPDLPGFGMSCRRDGHWSIGDFADNVLAVLDALGIERCVLVGGHLAAEIALETALRAPSRIRLVVLDGTPTWDAETREKIVAAATPKAVVPEPDGSHLTRLWEHLLWETAMWRPKVAWSESLGHFAMGLLGAKMLAGFDMRPARALAEYDAREALTRLVVPVLALTAEDDPLNNCHDTVLELCPSATGHCFGGDHPIHAPDRGADYFAPILARFRELDRAEETT